MAETGKSGPLQRAALARHRIVSAAESGSWSLQQLSNSEAAFFTGIPQHILTLPSFSLLVQPNRKGNKVHVVANNPKEVALTALRGWVQNEDPEIAAQFTQYSYLEIYGLIQKIIAGQGKQALKRGPGKLILTVLGEQDEFWAGFMSEAETIGSVETNGLEQAQERLASLWELLPQSQKDRWAQYDPRNVFNT